MPVQWRMPEPSRASALVAGVVLAAGASTRMGRNKLLLELQGSSVLRRAAQRASAAGLEPVIVVLGHEAERTRAELSGLPVQVALNPRYQDGLNASLRTGIGAVPPQAAAVVIVLADMPLVTSDMIGELVRQYRAGSAPLVASAYGGVNAPPMLFDRRLFPELLAETGEGCGRDVVRRHQSDADVVRWPPSALQDLDAPADFERVRARFDLL